MKNLKKIVWVVVAFLYAVVVYVVERMYYDHEVERVHKDYEETFNGFVKMEMRYLDRRGL